MPWSYFSECWALSQLFHSPLSLSSSSSSPSAIRVVSFTATPCLYCCSQGFSSCGKPGLLLRCVVLGGGFPCCRARAVVVALGFSCLVACGILRPAIELVSHALQVRFLTTRLPGESRVSYFYLHYFFNKKKKTGLERPGNWFKFQ